MRQLSPAIQSHLNARKGMVTNLLFTASGVNKTTLLHEQFRVWTGQTDNVFNVNGSGALYHGLGPIIEVAPLIEEIGLNVRTHRIPLSPLHPQVADALSKYDLRLQPIQLHVVYCDAVAGNVIDDPVLRFSGIISGQPLNEGETTTVEIEVLSAAHNLTRSLPLRKSNQALQARQPGDAFRRYIDVSGVIETVWGTQRGTAPAQTTTNYGGATGPSLRQ